VQSWPGALEISAVNALPLAPSQAPDIPIPTLTPHASLQLMVCRMNPIQQSDAGSRCEHTHKAEHEAALAGDSSLAATPLVPNPLTSDWCRRTPRWQRGTARVCRVRVGRGMLEMKAAQQRARDEAPHLGVCCQAPPLPNPCRWCEARNTPAGAALAGSRAVAALPPPAPPPWAAAAAGTATHSQSGSSVEHRARVLTHW
jgi:hypothetical protein